MTRRTRRWAFAAVATSLLLVSACGSSDTGSTGAPPVVSANGTGPVDRAALVAAAEQEGSVVLYTFDTEVVNKSIEKGFEAKYPKIDFQVFRAQVVTLLQRFQGEVDSGQPQADVLIQGDNAWLADPGPKYVVPTSDLHLPAVVDYPQKFVLKNSVVGYVTPAGFVYNTDLIADKDLPTSWCDLADPKWQGRTLGLDLKNGTFYPMFADYLLQKCGPGVLKSIGANPITSDVVVAAQQVAAGSAAATAPGFTTGVVPLKSKGAPINIKFFNDTTGAEPKISVTQTAPHPNAARLLEDFLLTPDGQAAMVGVTGSVSVLKGVPGTTPLPSGYESGDITRQNTRLDQIYSLLNQQRS